MSGVRNCPVDFPFSWLHFNAQGFGFTQAPGSSTFVPFNHAQYTSDIRSGTMFGGSWYVETDGGINGQVTYGFCTAVG